MVDRRVQIVQDPRPRSESGEARSWIEMLSDVVAGTDGSREGDDPLIPRTPGGSLVEWKQTTVGVLNWTVGSEASFALESGMNWVSWSASARMLGYSAQSGTEIYHFLTQGKAGR